MLLLTAIYIYNTYDEAVKVKNVSHTWVGVTSVLSIS